MSDQYQELNALYNYTTENFTNQLKNMIKQQEGNIKAMYNKINNKDGALREKMQRNIEQEREIDYKRKLILTRDRMLQLSQEKNVYKTKIVYTLISFIIFLTLIIMVAYTLFSQ